MIPGEHPLTQENLADYLFQCFWNASPVPGHLQNDLGLQARSSQPNFGSQHSERPAAIFKQQILDGHSAGLIIFSENFWGEGRLCSSTGLLSK